MARCDEGYLCAVCGQEVKRLVDSSLYLQYIVGWISADQLNRTRDIHLRCNPHLAQFIDSPEFKPPVEVSGQFDRRLLDRQFDSQRSQLITRGYDRLRFLQRHRDTTIQDYPLNL
ncbi:MAG: hypothetical protein KF752_17750 [Pirellulaceae bacterium]|nr:hypothetical protein [Pirellulaceae bacterium]